MLPYNLMFAVKNTSGSTATAVTVTMLRYRREAIGTLTYEATFTTLATLVNIANNATNTGTVTLVNSALWDGGYVFWGGDVGGTAGNLELRLLSSKQQDGALTFPSESRLVDVINFTAAATKNSSVQLDD